MVCCCPNGTTPFSNVSACAWGPLYECLVVLLRVLADLAKFLFILCGFGKFLNFVALGVWLSDRQTHFLNFVALGVWLTETLNII